MSEETAPQPPVKFTWLLGTLVAFALFAVVGAYSSHMTRAYRDYDQDRANTRYATLQALRQDANKTLTTADWIDQDKGIIRIPIDEAMAKEIDTLKSIATHQCEVIPGSVPAPPATTNAAPVMPATNAASTNAPPAAASAPPATNAPPTAPAHPAKKKKVTP